MSERPAGFKTSRAPVPRQSLFVTFVHGWHHRAKICDENLSCFRQVMQGLVERKDDREVPACR